MKHNQDGAVSGLAISLILATILLVAAVGFGGWAFSSRQDYKDHVDAKIQVAVGVAKGQQTKADAKIFAEAAKKPLKPYDGPEAYGSIHLLYPKTWSAYVDETSNSNAQVDGYFYPGFVPSINAQTSVFALRVQVISQPYSQVAKNMQSLGSNTRTPSTIAAYSLPKMPKIVGLMISGGLPANKTGQMVVLPLRSQTLQIWTEGSLFGEDFTNNILPTSHSPPDISGAALLY